MHEADTDQLHDGAEGCASLYTRAHAVAHITGRRRKGMQLNVQVESVTLHSEAPTSALAPQHNRTTRARKFGAAPGPVRICTFVKGTIGHPKILPASMPFRAQHLSCNVCSAVGRGVFLVAASTQLVQAIVSESQADTSLHVAFAQLQPILASKSGI